MSIIQRGFRGKLTEQNLTIKVKVDGSFTCDFTCFGVDSDNKLSDERYMIFYNQLSSPNGEITLANSANSASFTVNLDRLPANINKLAFTATIDGEGTMMQMQNLHLEIIP
ncbi:TerD family protein, partial [bacterium]|nr:TerD family protein [bacterium]